MSHSLNAEKFTANKERTHWHDKALWFVREKRDIATKKIDNFEELRSVASQIKEHTLAHLDMYLEQFEKNANARGIKVHWAKDANEHNKIVYEILRSKNATKVVKSKSMLTEECHLNPYLEQKGMEVIDTDLGERIVQLRNEPPSHIVLPAIHLKKEDVSTTFHEHMGTEKGNNDPQYLTHEARKDLREKFIGADAGITGVNFAVSESGGVVVCTNEGNADLGASLPKLHIACMGIEKIIPRLKDLGVFTRVLARSATGQPITSYTSHFHGPVEGGEMHVVILDNKRSEIIGKEDFYKSLKCIRCGACMNTCPVYRRSGGHSYGYTIPGPIGSNLAPHRDEEKHCSLPFASTLCGSCSNVCPVHVNLHEQLLSWRKVIVKDGLLDKEKASQMKFLGFLFRHPTLMDLGGKIFRKVFPFLPKSITHNTKKNKWVIGRELPKVPEKGFKELYAQEMKKRGKNVK